MVSSARNIKKCDQHSGRFKQQFNDKYHKSVSGFIYHQILNTVYLRNANDQFEVVGISIEFLLGDCLSKLFYFGSSLFWSDKTFFSMCVNYDSLFVWLYCLSLCPLCLATKRARETVSDIWRRQKERMVKASYATHASYACIHKHWSLDHFAQFIAWYIFL